MSQKKRTEKKESVCAFEEGRDEDSGNEKWSPWECYLIDCLENKELNSVLLFFFYLVHVYNNKFKHIY